MTSFKHQQVEYTINLNIYLTQPQQTCADSVIAQFPPVFSSDPQQSTKQNDISKCKEQITKQIDKKFPKKKRKKNDIEKRIETTNHLNESSMTVCPVKLSQY